MKVPQPVRSKYTRDSDYKRDAKLVEDINRVVNGVTVNVDTKQDISSGITLFTDVPGTTSLNTVIRLLGDKTDISADGTFSPNLGDFVISTGMTTFANETFQNFICTFGYNAQTSGQVNANEPSLYVNFESNYYAGAEGRPIQTSELYYQFINAQNTSAVRPIFFQVSNNESDIATYGYVIAANIYAGGIDGANGVNFFGSQAGTNSPGVAIANIKKNAILVNYLTGSPATAAFSCAISPESTFGTNLYMNCTSPTPSGAKALFFSWHTLAGGNEGGALLMGGRSGAAASFAVAPVLGAVGTLCTSTHPTVEFKSGTGQTATYHVQFTNNANTVLWGWDKDGLLDLDGSLTATGTGTTATSYTNKPGTAVGAQPATWVHIEINGTAHYIPAFLGT